jgi:hypothetical protein
MSHRSCLTDLAGLGLAAWAILLAYVSLPALAGPDPFWDDGISVLGGLLAVAHLAGAIGVMRRAEWGRRLGLAMGAIGLFGSAAVLLTLAGSMLGSGTAGVSGFIGLSLGIPAGMVAVYALIVVILVRTRNQFVTP